MGYIKDTLYNRFELVLVRLSAVIDTDEYDFK
jgi:hypothetical protein